jgi:hypothetical protein
VLQYTWVFRCLWSKLSRIPLGVSLEWDCWIIWQIYVFLRSLNIVFQSGCTNFLSHQQCIMVSFSPHPHQHMLLVVFLMIVILTGGILVWLWFSFLLWPEMVSIFSCVFWPFEFLLLKKFCLVQLPMCLLVIDFGGVSFFELPTYFGYQSFVWYIASKYFLLLCGWSL